VNIDELLDEARSHLRRIGAKEAARRQKAGAVLVDIRPVELRERDGEIPGALVVDRNVLEWRLDPSSAYRLPEARDYDQEFIVVCNEGYASSLAARSLQQLGLHNATDLIGGYQAWRYALLPVAQ
jgi:rhodanese-related sulfurtransferase